MASLVDKIEKYIRQMIEESDTGIVEIQRNQLADQFSCVPSQINYVLQTRFTFEKGYFVESRRGGGGYIKIQRVNITQPNSYLMHIISSMGERISQQSAEVFINNFVDYEAITEREAAILKAAVSDKVLGMVDLENRDRLRAAIMKNMLVSMLV